MLVITAFHDIGKYARILITAVDLELAEIIKCRCEQVAHKCIYLFRLLQNAVHALVHAPYLIFVKYNVRNCIFGKPHLQKFRRQLYPCDRRFQVVAQRCHKLTLFLLQFQFTLF